VVQAESNLKPRVIVLTDLKRVQETDDFQSVIRLLSLADLVEIEGIIISSGYNYWNPSHLIEGYELIWEILDAYEESVPNLMKMNEQKSFKLFESVQEIGYWPSANYLRRHTVAGTALVGMPQVGNNRSSEGSRLIINALDEVDPRPVYVLAWGGANVLAQALWDISENPAMKRSTQAVNSFISNLRVISLGDQDKSWNNRNERNDSSNSHYWMRKTFPNLFWVMTSPGEFMKKSNTMQPFYQAHIQGHGSLGDMYPDHSNGVEGDSPSLFYVLPTGFSDPEKPEWGTMAGIFEQKKSPMEEGTYFWQINHSNFDSLENANKELTQQFIQPLWNLFAARMDWARSSTGNRPPVIIINDVQSHGIFTIHSKAGGELLLDASKTFDREQDKISFKWSILMIPGNYTKDVKIEPDGRKLNVILPKEAKNQQIHLLLEVSDDGAGHHLTSFKRIIINVM
jgi:hypothetical protein